MLIMEPNGAIEPYTPHPAAGADDINLEHLLMLTEHLGQELAGEVRARVDARLAALAERLGPITSAGFGLALG